MGISVSDTFGPAMIKLGGLGDRLKKCNGKVAHNLQAVTVKGITTQESRSNSFEHWAPLSEKWLNNPEKKNDLMLVNRGALIRSVEATRVSDTVYHVGTNHEAALAHEFGYAPRKLPARPFLRPAIEKARKQMPEIYKEAFS